MWGRTGHKYNVGDKKRREMDNVVFDSIAEKNRYSELKMLQEAGLISYLSLQPKFIIIPKTRRTREHLYTADFRYVENNETFVEDVKGVRTTDYILRRDMFLSQYSLIRFREYHNGTIKEF